MQMWLPRGGGLTGSGLLTSESRSGVTRRWRDENGDSSRKDREKEEGSLTKTKIRKMNWKEEGSQGETD